MSLHGQTNFVESGDLLVEVDGRDVSNFDVKQVKEMTKGPPGSPLKLKAKRGANGSVYEVVLERSGGTGTSMASISDASSMQGNTTGVVSKELTASERGKEGSEAAMVLHEELDKMRASLATMTGELCKTKEELTDKSKEVDHVSGTVEPMKKELADSNAKLAESTRTAGELQVQLEEATQKLAIAAKSGDERVIALEKASTELEKSTKEQNKISEKQVSDLEKDLSASNTELAEFTCRASDLQGQLEEATQKLSMTSKSGDERAIALEKAQKEEDNVKMELRKISEKQALDLDEAQRALSSLHSAVCKQGPAPVLGGIGIALGTETINVKGKQTKMVKITQLASSGPAARSGMCKIGDLLVEIDGKDVLNLDIKQVKQLTKGAPGSPMRLKAQRPATGAQYEVVLERSGGTGTSMASVSDASSMASSLAGAAVGKILGSEPTLLERGKEGCDAAVALHEELDRLRRSLATATEELRYFCL